MSDLNPPGSYTPPPPPPPGGGIPGAPGGGDIIYPSQPPKDPILVLVLNLLLLGGVGYIILGQKTKGIVAIVTWIVLTVVTCGIGSVIAVVTAIDGYLQAQQLQQGHPIGQWTWFNSQA
jgi:hypothetical protein